MRTERGAPPTATGQPPETRGRAGTVVAGGVDALERELQAAAAVYASRARELGATEEHARRVADLELYLRQWHAERDQAALGQELLRPGAPGW